jgi:tetratricopeptide (TPR) repeat protein
MRLVRMMVVLSLLSLTAMAQASVAKEKARPKNDPPPRSDSQPASPGSPAAEQDASPRMESRRRTDEESSSRDNIIDLQPPRGDTKRPVRTDDDEVAGVGEMKPWNPHRAAKNVEVGEYHFKNKNYKAALSRFREALEYKPRDAVATYRLAQVLEATGQLDEALQRYEEYLQILKNGPFAEDCRLAIARIKPKLAS